MIVMVKHPKHRPFLLDTPDYRKILDGQHFPWGAGIDCYFASEDGPYNVVSPNGLVIRGPVVFINNNLTSLTDEQIKVINENTQVPV